MRRQQVLFGCASLLLGSLLFACGDDDQVDVVIETIEPSRGPLAGGNEITISGENLNGEDLRVVIGDVVSREVRVLEGGDLLVTVPGGLAVGPVDVIIATDDGVAAVDDGYEYNPLPAIESVVPDRGSVDGASISITGTGFLEFDAGTTQVSIGDKPCLGTDVQSDTVIVCTAPPADPWTLADVSISNANGEAVEANGFGYMKNGLFGIDGRGGIPGTLFFIDPDDGSFSPLASVGVALTGLASHVDGTVYGVTSNASAVGAGFPRDLVTIDPFTGAATTLGPLLTADAKAVRITDIAMEFDGSSMYGWNKTDDQLVTIALDGGLVSPVGGNVEVFGGALAFDLEGALYLSPDGSDGELLSVATETGETASFRDLVDTTGDDINSMTFFLDTMYGLREGVSTDGITRATFLLDVNLDTGIVTEVSEMPPGLDALTRTPPLPFM